MPKKPRSPQEVQQYKEKILDEALSIISEKGYQGLSMRGLASRLGKTATTIYDYYTNKDSLYLSMLTRGFEMLEEKLENSLIDKKEMGSRLDSLTESFLGFGITHSNYYDIMFIRDVPKYDDYKNTPLEEEAASELKQALKCRDIALDIIAQQVKSNSHLDNEKTEAYYVKWLAGIHGLISLHNSSILKYLPMEKEIDLKEMIKLNNHFLYSPE